VRSQKRLPGRRALRRRRQTVALQDARNRGSADLVPEILQGTLNPGVTPRRIVLGHAQRQLADRSKDTATGPLPAIRPLARHQRPVPPKQRVRCDNRCEVTQCLPSQPVCPYREAPTIVIAEPEAPLTDLPPQDAILFDQIGERFPLSVIEPTGNGQEQQPKDRHVDHEPELISRICKKTAAIPSILSWDITSSPHLQRLQRFNTFSPASLVFVVVKSVVNSTLIDRLFVFVVGAARLPVHRLTDESALI
jgi:hypothetical protein